MHRAAGRLSKPCEALASPRINAHRQGCREPGPSQGEGRGVVPEVPEVPEVPAGAAGSGMGEDATGETMPSRYRESRTRGVSSVRKVGHDM